MRRPSKPNNDGGVFPSGRQSDLIQACIGDDPLASWQRYRGLLGEAAANLGEQRLYPIVASRLPEDFLKSADGRALKRIRQAALLRAQVMEEHCRRLHRLCAPLRIEPVFLKGIALSRTIYRRPGVRISSDIDFYVPCQQALAVGDMAREEGWRLIWQAKVPGKRFDERVLKTRHSAGFVTPDGVEIDLHWVPRRALVQHPELIARFESDCRQSHGGDWAMRVPSPTWLLFETIDHGIYRNAVTPIRWIVDGVAILQEQGEAIDWPLLEEIAGRTKRSLILSTGLRTIAAYGAPVPEAVVERLERRRVSALERKAFALRFEPHRAIVGPLQEEAVHYFAEPGRASFAGLLGFPLHFLRNVYQINGPRDALRELLRKFRHRAPDGRGSPPQR